MISGSHTGGNPWANRGRGGAAAGTTERREIVREEVRQTEEAPREDEEVHVPKAPERITQEPPEEVPREPE